MGRFMGRWYYTALTSIPPRPKKGAFQGTRVATRRRLTTPGVQAASVSEVAKRTPAAVRRSRASSSVVRPAAVGKAMARQASSTTVTS